MDDLPKENLTWLGGNELSDLLDIINLSESKNGSIKGHLIDIFNQIQKQTLFKYHLTTLASAFRLYLSPPILIIGVIGTLMSAIVLMKHSKKQYVYKLLFVLAVMDIVIVTVGLGRLWLREVTEIDIAILSSTTCKLVVFTGFFSSHCSVWIVTAISLKRAWAVNTPFKSKRKNTEGNVKNIIILIFVSAGVLDLHIFFTVDVVEHSSSLHTCGSISDTMDQIWPWVDVIAYICIPWTIVCTANISTLLALFKARKNRLDMLKNLHKRDRNYFRKSHRKMSMMLIVLSLSFILLLLPMNVVMVITKFWNNEFHSIRELSILTLVKTIAELLMYINHGTNFVLYFWSGSQFRGQFRSMFCRPRKTARQIYNRHLSLTSIALHSYD